MAETCTLCGEPMQPGEEMFKYHGSLGPCPKPPLKRAVTSVVEYIHRDQGGKFWIDFRVDRAPHGSLGPFDTKAERERAHNDLLDMMRTTGAVDVPNYQQIAK